MRILIIEDERNVAETIKDSLSGEFVVDIADNGKDGVYMAVINDYDLIIIDYLLPDDNGDHVCKMIRKSEIYTPVLFLTGRDQIKVKIAVFSAGADDFMPKPFSAKELLARCRALLRRSDSRYCGDVLYIDDLVVDTLHRTVKVGSKYIDIRRKGFDLLEYLVRNQNRIVTRSSILEHVWEDHERDMSNTVDVHIKYLRDMIDKPYKRQLIRTVHGLGYAMTSDQKET